MTRAIISFASKIEITPLGNDGRELEEYLPGLYKLAYHVATGQFAVSLPPPRNDHERWDRRIAFTRLCRLVRYARLNAAPKVMPAERGLWLVRELESVLRVLGVFSEGQQ